MKPKTSFRQFVLHDKVQVFPGYLSSRSLLVYASDKPSADITARMHHCLILHQLGVL